MNKHAQLQIELNIIKTKNVGQFLPPEKIIYNLICIHMYCVYIL